MAGGAHWELRSVCVAAKSVVVPVAYTEVPIALPAVGTVYLMVASAAGAVNVPVRVSTLLFAPHAMAVGTAEDTPV
jgi:hypothetical protein